MFMHFDCLYIIVTYCDTMLPRRRPDLSGEAAQASAKELLIERNVDANHGRITKPG